ncbi:condensation domain-containing protein, partial [Bacillus paramobilis]
MGKQTIVNSTIEDIYALTPMQEGMLFQNILDKKSTSYVVQSVYNLDGAVDKEKIGQSLKLLSRKHDVLRTVILHQKINKPRQVVLRNKDIEYEVLDLSNFSEEEQEKKILEVTRLDVKRGFDLQKDSLLRVKYIKLGNEVHKLIWSIHHIIMDGWCLSLVFG